MNKSMEKWIREINPSERLVFSISAMTNAIKKWIREINLPERLVFFGSAMTNAMKKWIRKINPPEKLNFFASVMTNAMKRWIGEINPSERRIFVSVLILGILISVGSINNGCSIFGSFIFGILVSIFEFILIYNALVRKSMESLIAVLGLWLLFVCLGVYFFFNGKHGLLIMAIGSFALCLWLIKLYKIRIRPKHHPSAVTGNKLGSS